MCEVRGDPKSCVGCERLRVAVLCVSITIDVMVMYGMGHVDLIYI